MTANTTTPQASRIHTFDLARGLAILFMILIHVLDFYGQSYVRESLFGEAVTFLGRPPAAPVFMFIMGIFIFLSPKADLATGLKRAAWLIVLGYALNLARGSIPMWLSLEMGLVTYEQLGGLTPLTEFLIVDILQFAGLAFAVCVLLKHYLANPIYWLLASTLVMSLSPLIWDFRTGHTVVDEVLKLFWGHKDQGAMFPLFPWLVYPLLGMAFGYWFKQHQSKAHFFRRSGLLGLAIMATGTLLTLSNIDFHYAYYLRSGPGLTLWIIGFVLTWIWLCDLAVTKVKANPAFEALYFWSQHVTAIYILQWILVGWGLMAVGVQQLSFLHTLFAMAGVMLAADLSLRAWLSMKRKTKPVKPVIAQ